MFTVKLYLLGSPRLERDGQIVEMDTRKAMALVAYLALTETSHSRDSLAAMFWPDYDQTRARAALRRTLSTLNRGLPEGMLQISREEIGLSRPPSLWCDVLEFNRAEAEIRLHGHPAQEPCSLCIPVLERAVGLYRSDLMAGFSLRDSAAFDDWQFFHTDTLRRQLAGYLETLVEAERAQGRFAQAITYARRRLSLDPLHEPAHRLLMQLYVWAGERGAALRQYQECARILETELGVKPLEETSRLYQEIKKNRQPPQPSGAPESQPTAPAAVKPVGVSALPLVGRASELAEMQQRFTHLEGRSFLLALEGEAGIGKTRLAEELVAWAQQRGARLASGRCYPDESGLAFAPLAAALRSVIAQASPDEWQALPAHWKNAAARLLPELQTALPSSEPHLELAGPAAQSQYLEGISQVFKALLVRPAAGILFLDDLHWADDASLELLAYLVRRLEQVPLLFLVTWRGEDLPPEHRLRRLLAEAQRAGRASLLCPARFSRNQVAELVQRVNLASTTSPNLEKQLFEETEGLPFFLTEYLAVLSQEAERTGAANHMPHGVRALLQSRLQTVSETGLQLLQTAAVIGRSFDFDTLQSASGRTPEEVTLTLEALLAHGLIQEKETAAAEHALLPPMPQYDFSHQKIRTLVYAETSLARRRLLHQRVAQALLRVRAGLPAVAGQAAYHFRQAGQAQEAAQYYQIAGEHARSVYAHAEGRAFFQAALALGHPDPAALNEAVADLQTLQGEYAAAAQSYQTAIIQRQSGDRLLSRLQHKLGNLYHRQGEWDLAEAHFQAAALTLSAASDPAGAAQLFADRSLTAHLRDQPQTARQMAEQALALACQAGDAAALAQAHNILGILSRRELDLPKAVHHLEHSLEAASQAGSLQAQSAALNNLALTYADLGRLGDAVSSCQAALTLCERLGDRHRQAALHNNLADLYHACGQEEPAMLHLKQAVAIFAEISALDDRDRPTAPSQPEIWKLTEW